MDVGLLLLHSVVQKLGLCFLLVGIEDFHGLLEVLVEDVYWVREPRDLGALFGVELAGGVRDEAGEGDK